MFSVRHMFWREIWIFDFYKNDFDEYKKRYNSYDKMVYTKVVDIFEINNSVYWNFVRISYILSKKLNFRFFEKRFWWMKPGTLVKNGWLTNSSFFLGDDNYSQTVTIVKTNFSHSRAIKTSKFYLSRVKLLHKKVASKNMFYV